MSDNHTKKESFLYRLLVNPSYRVLRHAVLVLTIAVISVSQTAHSLLANVEAIGNLLYPIAAVTLVAYLLVGYFHIYILVPKLLLHKRYLAYVLISCLSVGLITVLKPAIEYWTVELLSLPPERTDYFNAVSFLDSLSDFMQIMLCITGASVTVLLKNWLTESRRVGELEKQHLQSEVDSMKEQVNPELLFHTLNRAGNLAGPEPDKAADMILQLSQLLRYELYDGSREKVLLSAEIRFLEHYLTLEQFYDDSFDFRIAVKGNTLRVFIPPLLFIPFVQAIVGKIRPEEGKPMLELRFDGGDDRLDFTAAYAGDPLRGEEVASALSRLDHLYPGGYSFTTGDSPEEQGVIARLQLKSVRP